MPSMWMKEDLAYAGSTKRHRPPRIQRPRLDLRAFFSVGISAAALVAAGSANAYPITASSVAQIFASGKIVGNARVYWESNPLSTTRELSAITLPSPVETLGSTVLSIRPSEFSLTNWKSAKKLTATPIKMSEPAPVFYARHVNALEDQVFRRATLRAGKVISKGRFISK